MNKIILAVPAAALLLTAPLCGAAPKAGAPQAPLAQVLVAPAREADEVDSRRYSGLVMSPAVVQLVPRVSGELLQIGFKDGDFVKKGQMLYKFDPVRYEAAVKSAEAKIAECNARLEYAQSSYQRNKELYSKQATSRDTMENTQSSLEAYKSALLAAEANLITAKDDLANTVIHAPMDGVIGVTKYTVGNYITPNSGVLCTINQIAPLRVRFAMSNRDFLNLFGSLDNLKKHAGISLRLANNALFDEAGKVELIDNEANRTTDTIQIYAIFPNTRHTLIPGSTVTVLLSRASGNKYPAVLPSAILHDAKTAYCYVMGPDNIPVRRDVVLGNDLGDLVLIKSGVKAGETVIVDGTHKIRPGVPVEPVEKK